MTQEEFQKYYEETTPQDMTVNIELAEWLDSDHRTVKAKINGVDYFIPSDPSNTQYVLLQNWEKNGNKIKEYKKPADAIVIPDMISRRQFYQQLAEIGLISKKENIDRITKGIVPPTIQNVIDMIPNEDVKYQMIVLLLEASEFQRGHPFIHEFGQMFGMDAAAIDGFFYAASKLN